MRAAEPSPVYHRGILATYDIGGLDLRRYALALAKAVVGTARVCPGVPTLVEFASGTMVLQPFLPGTGTFMMDGTFAKRPIWFRLCFRHPMQAVAFIHLFEEMKPEGERWRKKMLHQSQSTV